MAFTAKSNEATEEALMKARTIIGDALNTIRAWEHANSGAEYSTSAKAAKIKLLTDLDSDEVAAQLAIAKTWDGKKSTSSDS